MRASTWMTFFSPSLLSHGRLSFEVQQPVLPNSSPLMEAQDASSSHALRLRGRRGLDSPRKEYMYKG